MTVPHFARRLATLGLLLWVTGCLIALMALAAPAIPAVAQDEPPPPAEEEVLPEESSEPADDAQAATEAVEEKEFVGAGDCGDCHRGLAQNHEDTLHAQALLDVSRRKQGILADFDAGEDIRTIQFPGEDAPRAFTEDDIAYAIGAGRYMQRYVAEVDDQLMVLPATWDTVNGVWTPYTPAEEWPAPEYDFVAQCAGCHTVGLDVERGRWEDDGVQCEACHGPGSLHVELAEDAGRRPNEEEIAAIHAAIVLSPDAQICGQCHSQGATPDGTHPFPIGFHAGDPLLDPETFVLASEDDAAVWFDSGHGRLNNMQFNEWFSSRHADSLDTLRGSANAQDDCLACHSGDAAFYARIVAAYEDETLTGELPAAPTVETATTGVSCVTCHSPHDPEEDVSLLAAEPYDLCTSCHRNTELVSPVHHPVVEMFEGQALVDDIEGIPSVHFSAEEGPRCATCHMALVSVESMTLPSHTWQPVIPGETADSPPDACSTCHEGLSTSDLESLVLDTQASIKSRLSVASARLGSVTPPEAGTDAAADYERVVAAIAFVQNDGSLGVHNFAYADALLDEAAGLLSALSVPGATLEPTQGPHPTATPSAPQPITVSAEVPARTGARPMTLIIIGAIGVFLIGSAAIIWWRAWRYRKQEKAP